MKKLLIPFILITAALFQSCRGPEGPAGPAGLDGPIGQTFEVENVNFNTGNGFQYRTTFNNANVDFLESDVVLVYILWDVDNGAPIWRLLPQPIDMPRGIIYNFDFTPSDFTIFIDAPTSVNLSTLSADFTQNQTFRVVALPSDFNSRKSGEPVDYKDYEAVKKHFNLDESKIQTISAN
ncbi:hypothetical protein [Dyadobacter psychrotolerans]|uniref:Collagen-like protein n=1 Tax=Dyadobacter psychrotolerans TaxID=2541721 RepID=A0A4R5DHH0_9BACT|nr:hypothetical protein [Dyadobacter psychrotolerans]TDE11371.1 hypothetical protein E0F88_26030 [Dyadobacter psychrotolerans]